MIGEEFGDYLKYNPVRNHAFGVLTSQNAQDRISPSPCQRGRLQRRLLADQEPFCSTSAFALSTDLLIRLSLVQ